MKKTKRFWGLLLIAVAVILLLDQTGVIPKETSVFKLIVSAILIPVFISGIIQLKYTRIFLPCGIFFIMFSKNFGLSQISPSLIFLSAVLLSIGCYTLFPKKIVLKRKFCNTRSYTPTAYSFEDNSSCDSIVFIENNCSGCNKYITSNCLEEVFIKSSYGGTNVYLNNAIPKGDTVKLELELAYSGVNVYIPQNWRILCTAESIMSGITMPKTPSGQNCNVTLKTTGEVKLSGLRFIYI